MNQSTKLLQFVILVCSVLLFGTATSTMSQAVRWKSFEKALPQAKSNDKLIVVDVWAPWCGWCHKMKQETYPRLPDELRKQFIFTRLNRDNRKTEHRYKGQQLTSLRLAQKLHAQSVPTVVILSSGGNYLFHISGFLPATKLQEILEKAQQLTSRQ